MILIVVVDDRNGMMFNHRRQSQDRILREKILELPAGRKLWVNSYTANQFKGEDSRLVIDESFFEKAEKEDFCFAEDSLPSADMINKLILFKWNRKYPGDFFFDIDISSWKLIKKNEFAGSSHSKITMEVYNHE